MSGRDYFCFRCPNPDCGRIIQQRTEGQNRQLHTICGRLSKEQDWPAGSGRKWSAKFWKRMLIANWQRAHKREAAAVPALDGTGEDGSGFDFISSADFPISEMDELLEWADKWAETNGSPG